MKQITIFSTLGVIFLALIFAVFQLLGHHLISQAVAIATIAILFIASSATAILAGRSGRVPKN